MMKIAHETRLLALVTLCGALALPACTTADEGEQGFGGLGDAGDADPDDGTESGTDDGDEPGTDDGDASGTDAGDESGTDDGDAPGTDDGDAPGTDDGDAPGTDDGDAPGTDDGDAPPMAEDDGDFQANPAVLAQFRNTSPAPVSVMTPLFNEDAIDTKGLQYLGEVSDPGDDEDWIQFNIVPGQVDPTIRVFLDCESAELSPQPLRANLIDDEGQTLETIVCGQDAASVTLFDASSDREYFVQVQMLEGSEHLDSYTLQINAYCFMDCDYQPYGG